MLNYDGTSPQASSSAIRLYPSTEALFTITRILVVETGVKVNFRHALLFPVTVPPGTVTQAVPVQYWISKLISEYCVVVVVISGGVVFEKSSLTAKTEISSIDLMPLKVTVSTSGNTPGVLSFHAPPMDHTRLPSIALDAGLSSVDPAATPPFVASA